MRISLIAFLLSFCLCAQQQAAKEPDAAPARKAAEKWLPLVDSGKYGESWKQAADFFQKTVTEEQWKEACTQARAPLGKFKSRSFALSQFVKDPPNAPPGDYYLIQFTADFENRNSATETAILFRQSETGWRLAGYFIK